MRVSRVDSECKYKITDSGYLFEFNTAYELGHLMASILNRVENPYDPQSTDYDDFNRAAWEYRDSLEVNK